MAKEKFQNFNSHAHVERDEYNERVFNDMLISTHTLTWSVTIVNTFPSSNSKISTHTLTWSVTACRR